VFPVRYELGFYVPEDGIFIVTAVKTSDLEWSSFVYGFYFCYIKTPAQMPLSRPLKSSPVLNNM
jgi:hypothetical protein